jgi:hypothetical protein
VSGSFADNLPGVVFCEIPKKAFLRRCTLTRNAKSLDLVSSFQCASHQLSDSEMPALQQSDRSFFYSLNLAVSAYLKTEAISIPAFAVLTPFGQRSLAEVSGIPGTSAFSRYL